MCGGVGGAGGGGEGCKTTASRLHYNADSFPSKASAILKFVFSSVGSSALIMFLSIF